MKIVVVDHIYLEEQDLEKLRSLGELEVFREPPESTEEIQRRIDGAEIVIVGWSRLTREIIERAHKLRMVSIWATSCHYVDVEAARERQIVVTHVPAYSTEAVAEHAFALLLASIRKLLLADRHVRDGRFDWRPFRGFELAGKTIGIIGTGLIGSRVAEIAKAFGMNVLAYDISPYQMKASRIGFQYVSLGQLLKESDIVSLHVPLTPETERLLGREEMEMMKKGAVVINTSQGKVIDENALVNALRSEKISYAGLDVFEEEPSTPTNPLFALDNALLSPHIAFHTVEAVRRCTDICIDNVLKFLEGGLQNLCYETKPSQAS